MQPPGAFNQPAYQLKTVPHLEGLMLNNNCHPLLTIRQRNGNCDYSRLKVRVRLPGQVLVRSDLDRAERRQWLMPEDDTVRLPNEVLQRALVRVPRRAD